MCGRKKIPITHVKRPVCMWISIFNSWPTLIPFKSIFSYFINAIIPDVIFNDLCFLMLDNYSHMYDVIIIRSYYVMLLIPHSIYFTKIPFIHTHLYIYPHMCALITSFTLIFLDNIKRSQCSIHDLLLYDTITLWPHIYYSKNISTTSVSWH